MSYFRIFHAESMDSPLFFIVPTKNPPFFRWIFIQKFHSLSLFKPNNRNFSNWRVIFISHEKCKFFKSSKNFHEFWQRVIVCRRKIKFIGDLKMVISHLLMQYSRSCHSMGKKRLNWLKKSMKFLDLFIKFIFS